MVRNEASFSKGSDLIMRKVSVVHVVRLIGGGGLLLFTTGCLGPNPLFFLGSSAAGASVGRLVNLFFDMLVGGS